MITQTVTQQPNHLISQRWTDVVQAVKGLSGTDPQAMAFTLTMQRISRRPDPRHTHRHAGCAACAQQAMSEASVSDSELLALFYQHLDEINVTLRRMRRRRRVRLAA